MPEFPYPHEGVSISSAASLASTLVFVHGASLPDPSTDYESAFDIARFESQTQVLTSTSTRSYCRRIDDAVDLTNLSQPERMQHVLRLLETRDYVQVAELSQAFAVSEVTVRSDLGQLARQGLVARIRGGARALQHGQSEVGFDLRMRLEVEAKRAIARAAAEMVNEGEAVALDASTTAYYLALELCSKRELVVVTNGLLVATALADAPGITVLLTGGVLRLSAMSLVGDLGTDVLRTTRINKGFLGARGLSLPRGLMDLNPDEVRIKQEMADACDQVYGIFDGTKWHRSALLAFVPVEELTGIVTDSSAPASEVDAWRAAGVDVITVDPRPGEAPPVRPRDLRRVTPTDEAVA